MARYNSQIRRHKRQISLSEQPDSNNAKLEPEVSITPNMRRDPSKGSKMLFVQDGEPTRQSLLTSKHRTGSKQQ